jgi:TolB-like protein/class 3 adenylate cyclase/Flp pilus assembly protein TadD
VAGSTVVRKLVAIFVADTVGYSRMMQADEVGTHARFKTDLETLLRPKIREHRGRVIKMTGDGLLAEFDSVVDAVQCAHEIQSVANARTAAPAETAAGLRYRIGINLGDVMIDDGDIYGDDVNIAVRLESLAEPGGITLSDAAYRSVRRKLDLHFRDLGEHRFKNIPEPVRVFSLPGNHAPGLTKEAQPDAAPGSDTEPFIGKCDSLDLDSPGKPSIVVLPLENLGSDPEQEYFCDGLTNDITTDLSKFRNLFVIAANSAFAYKHKRPTPREVGKELGVRYLLEGSVHRSGQSLRINVQLIDAVTGLHLWADRFEAELEQMRTALDEIIQRIVVALAFKVDVAEQTRVLLRPPVKLSAYEAYLKGEHLFTLHSEEQLKRSRDMFALATRLDPSFARAWGYYGYTVARCVVAGWSPREALWEALEVAQKAVALEPDDYSVHWDLAFVTMNLGYFEESLSNYERAVLLNPNDADLLCEMAAMLIRVGDPDRGIQKIKRAMRINPYFPDWYVWNLGWSYFNARQYEEALRELVKISNPPKNVWLVRAAASARLGRGKEAREMLDRFLKMDPDCRIADQKDREVFKRPEDEEHWLESLRMAGLPE